MILIQFMVSSLLALKMTTWQKFVQCYPSDTVARIDAALQESPIAEVALIEKQME